MDDDLDSFTHEALLAEVKRLREGIRAHRDASGHELCWHHPALWGLLPERTDPLPVVPDWPQFLRGCIRYRQSLDEQLPGARRVSVELPHHPATTDARAIAAVLWERLDVPGHDACRLLAREGGWRLEGTAVFLEGLEGAAPARLDYVVDCDAGWRSVRALVDGFFGARRLSSRIERDAGGDWRLDGRAVPGLADCVDVDLSFTPATNAFQLRRLALSDGQAASAPAAWLDLDDIDGGPVLRRLSQRYSRESETRFGYASTTTGYEAVLEVEAGGFVRDYPGLWRAVSS